jgi:halocyanin-like protein
MTRELTRRDLLGIAGAAGSVALAGCGGVLGDKRGVPGTPGSESDGSGPGGDSGGSIPEAAPEAVHNWLMEGDGGQAAQIYSSGPSAADMTGQDSATITVGAGGQGVAFDPPLAIVSTGTEVTWEWSGEGGSHNVKGNINSDSIPVDIQLDSGAAQSSAGTTYSYTFEESGVAPYVCVPHRLGGMLGAVVVHV